MHIRMKENEARSASKPASKSAGTAWVHMWEGSHAPEAQVLNISTFVSETDWNRGFLVGPRAKEHPI